MKPLSTALILLNLAGTASAQSVYGNCPDASQTYQTRYETSGRSRDLVCFQKALERELANGGAHVACPRTSEFYQSAYESKGRSRDLVCFQKALTRELQ